MFRKVRRISLAFVIATALGTVAVIVVTPSAAHSRSSRDRPQLAQHRILRIAETAAARAGDPQPTLIQHSEGTRHNANLVDSGDVVPGRQWSYLIAERGHFVLNGAPAPPRSTSSPGLGPHPGGQRVNRPHHRRRLSNRYPRLARLGPVHTDLRQAVPNSTQQRQLAHASDSRRRSVPPGAPDPRSPRKLDRARAKVDRSTSD